MTFLAVRRFDRSLTAFAQSWRGCVETVYRHAAILKPDQEGPLLTLLHPIRELVPFGIGIPWGLVRPRLGQEASLSGQRLTLADGPGRRRVLILQGDGVSLRLETGPSFMNAAILDQELAGIRFPPRTQALLGSKSVVGSSLERELIRRAGERLQQLVDRLCLGSAEVDSFREDVARLTGLGPGSTPTGDDLLVGVAAAAYRLHAAGWLPVERLTGFCSSLKDIPAQATTSTGREMIAHAARGSFPEPLLRFVNSLGSGQPGRPDPVWEAAKLARTGEQSGCDMLAGVLALLRAASRSTIGGGA